MIAADGTDLGPAYGIAAGHVTLVEQPGGPDAPKVFVARDLQTGEPDIHSVCTVVFESPDCTGQPLAIAAGPSILPVTGSACWDNRGNRLYGQAGRGRREITPRTYRFGKGCQAVVNPSPVYGTEVLYLGPSSRITAPFSLVLP